MLLTKYSALVARAALVGSLLAAANVRAIAQERESLRSDLSGRWRLNQELSENAQAKVNGRDVQTKWDKQRLVSEISVGDAKVTETYERSTNAPQLIVTTRMDMRGHDVSVRRVYDAEGAPDDPNKEVTVTGTVADVNTGGPGRLGWLMRVHTLGLGHKGAQETQLLVNTDKGAVQIHVGPTAFLKQKGVKIKEGDTVEVIGSRVARGEAELVLAREIRTGTGAWTLRDTTGQPLWSSAPTEARGFWTTKKVVLTVAVVKAALLFTVLRH